MFASEGTGPSTWGVTWARLGCTCSPSAAWPAGGAAAAWGGGGVGRAGKCRAMRAGRNTGTLRSQAVAELPVLILIIQPLAHLPPHLRRSSIGPLAEQLRPPLLPLPLLRLSRPASLPAPLGQRARPLRRLPQLRRWRRRSSTASSPAGCPAVAPHHRFILMVAGCGCPSAGTSERVMEPRAINTSAAVRWLVGGQEGGWLLKTNL